MFNNLFLPKTLANEHFSKSFSPNALCCLVSRYSVPAKTSYMASVAAGFWGSAACCTHSKLSRSGSLKLGRGRSPTSMLSGRRCSGVPALVGGAVSPGPVVAEVVEAGLGVAVGEAGRELFEACRSGDLDRVQKLLTPQNVNSRDTAGRKSTPLHFAAGKAC